MALAPHHNERYELLDELRGIAALIVLLFHVGTRTGAPAIAANGYLAVDFFFMLSGFVIAQAYGKRLSSGMGFTDFTRRRLARMMPIVLLGVCLGTAYALTRWFAAPSRSDNLGGILASAALNGMLLPKWWHGQATGWEVFPINGPLWSLFFEVVINLAWAGLLVSRRPAVLVAATLASMIALILVAGHYRSMDLGWDLPTLPGGLARVSFGFLTGLLIHAARDRLPRLGKGAASLSVALIIAALVLPLHATPWLIALTVMVLPAALLLAVCAGHQHLIPGAGFLGAISYAVYGLHVPFLALYSGLAERVSGRNEAGFEAYLVVPAILAVAALATRYYDGPAQRLLRRWIGEQRPPTRFSETSGLKAGRNRAT